MIDAAGLIPRRGNGDGDHHASDSSTALRNTTRTGECGGVRYMPVV